MKKVKFKELKSGDCFRLRKNGPIYMKDSQQGGQQILGKQAGKITDWFGENDKNVFPAKVKISEVK